MGEPYFPSDYPLSPTVAEQMDKVRDSFESAWKTAAATGERPRIEDYLLKTPEPERTALLRELISLDIDYHQQAGEHPPTEEYRAKFSLDPDLAAQLARPFPVDRNVLFGIFALQMGFISRATLLAAIQAWVLDKAKPLGQILTEQGSLRQEDRELLEVLIKRHVQMHGDTSQLSLAALSTVESLREDLQQIADPELHASLAHVPGAAPYVARPRAVGKPSVPGVRFRILREHAEGGLGKVFLAQDEELHRQVALKEIKEKYAHRPDSRARFLLEAEVTGGLEHPGIVPVYGLGCYPDGRPFYAMRFIKGNSLHEAILRFYTADQVRRDPGERSLAFRELLGQFVAACNALAYAHARGVLHRDVKPHNIMLGKYGETLVVDWGLAKVIGHREGLAGSDEGTLLPSSGGDSSPTQVGNIMGTPAYMSPEQAEGRLDQIGPASDIYSLGATLYELLTGQRPFEGHDILARVKRGVWLPPRRVRKDVPAALDAICRKALALRPEERYPSALALAADIEHWLADEPVAAYREPWSGRLRRWMRRHRSLAAGAAGLLVTAVLALAVGLVAVNHQKQRAQRAVAAEVQAKRVTQEALDIIWSPVIEDWLSRQTGKIEPVQNELMNNFLNNALASYRAFAEDSGDTQEIRSGVAKAHQRVGDISSRLNQHPVAENAYRRAIDYYEKLIADFRRADYRQELARSYNGLGNLLKDTGHPKEAEEAYRGGLTLQKHLAAEFADKPDYSQDLARSQINFGNLLKNTGHPKEAEEAYRDALTLYKQLAAKSRAVPSYRRDLAATQNNLGNLLQVTDRPGEADGAYREAVALYRQLAAEFPGRADYCQDLAKSQNNLALLLGNTNRPQQAEGPLREAVALCQQLAAEFPAVPEYRQELATSRTNLGNLLKDTNRPKDAEAAYRNALGIRKQLAAEFRKMPAYRQDLARSHNNLGALLAETRQLQEAEEHYGDALTLQKQLAAESPNVPEYHNDLANTMVNLAELLRDRKDFPQARELLERARPHHQAALGTNSLISTYRQSFRNNRVVLASILAGLDDHAGARQAAEQLAAHGWDSAGDAYAAARALAQCARVLDDDGKLSAPRRQELVRSYSEQTLAMLRQAISKGYKDAAHIKKDTDLDALRTHPEFQKLLRELEAKTERK